MLHTETMLRTHPTRRRGDVRKPWVDLMEDEGMLVARIDLPGVTGDDLELFLGSSALVVRGRRSSESHSPSARWHRRERGGGLFSCRIELPRPVQRQGVQTRLRNGILEVRLPLPGLRSGERTSRPRDRASVPSEYYVG